MWNYESVRAGVLRVGRVCKVRRSRAKREQQGEKEQSEKEVSQGEKEQGEKGERPMSPAHKLCACVSGSLIGKHARIPGETTKHNSCLNFHRETMHFPGIIASCPGNYCNYQGILAFPRDFLHCPGNYCIFPGIVVCYR